MEFNIKMPEVDNAELVMAFVDKLFDEYKSDLDRRDARIKEQDGIIDVLRKSERHYHDKWQDAEETIEELRETNEDAMELLRGVQEDRDAYKEELDDLKDSYGCLLKDHNELIDAYDALRAEHDAVMSVIEAEVDDGK